MPLLALPSNLQHYAGYDHGLSLAMVKIVISGQGKKVR